MGEKETLTNPCGIRIVEIPSCKMASSGNGALGGPELRMFDDWFSHLPKTLTPQDYMWYDLEQRNMVWTYVITDPMMDTKNFALIDFEGGLYAAAISIDSQEGDGERVYKLIKEWIEAGDIFALDERPGHYCMFHVPTPKEAQKALGYCQLDIFVPIRVK